VGNLFNPQESLTYIELNIRALRKRSIIPDNVHGVRTYRRAALDYFQSATAPAEAQNPEYA
jgi:hypothetical protein